jgi:hypothetical protein
MKNLCNKSMREILGTFILKFGGRFPWELNRNKADETTGVFNVY